MPRVVAELHGFEHYAWVTTAYLLTSTTVVPIVGKLSDMYGRKLVPPRRRGVFVLRSALCGLSQDMTQLIVFPRRPGRRRGHDAGIAFTVIVDLFPPAQRARIQGVFGAVFGLASSSGPLLGGFLTEPGAGAGCSTSTCRSA